MRTVLLAEDDALLRGLIAETLSAAGYRVLPAADGQEAWEALGRAGADLAVLDLNMPRLDGLALTRRIRGSRELRGLPVLMLTVRSAVKDQIAGFEGGADDYLAKPFDTQVLLARLRALERRALGPRG